MCICVWICVYVWNIPPIHRGRRVYTRGIPSINISFPSYCFLNFLLLSTLAPFPPSLYQSVHHSITVEILHVDIVRSTEEFNSCIHAPPPPLTHLSSSVEMCSFSLQLNFPTSATLSVTRCWNLTNKSLCLKWGE